MYIIQIETLEGKTWAYSNVESWLIDGKQLRISFGSNDVNDLVHAYVNIDNILTFEVIRDRGTPINE